MNRRIYLAGAMTGLKDNPDYVLGWRKDFVDALPEFSVVNPCDYFWEDPDVTDWEAMIWDLYQVRHSDLIIVNFSHCATSLGTQHELAVASELNIPIIGLNETGEELHPWSRLVCQKIFSDREDLLYYIRRHYYQ